MDFPPQLIYLLLGWVAFFFLHSFLASIKVKTWFSQFRNSYRLFYNLFAIATLFPLIYGQIRVGNLTAIASPFWIRIIGVVILIAGIAVLYMATRSYDMGRFSGFSQMQGKGYDEDESLNVKGINRLMRHPIYSGSLLIFLGYALANPSMASIGLFLLSLIYIRIGIWLEERKLLIYFGESYAKYRRRVPMLIPRLGDILKS